MIASGLLAFLPLLAITSTSAAPISAPKTLIKALHYGDYCLVVDNNGTPDTYDWESEVYLAACGDKADHYMPCQKWALPAVGQTGHVQFNDELCLDAGENPGNGSGLKLWECLDVPQQIFTVDANDHIRLGAFNQCVDVKKESGPKKEGYTFFGKYRDVQTWECSDSDPEQREYHCHLPLSEDWRG